MSNSTTSHASLGSLVVMSIESVATLLLQYLVGALVAYNGLVAEADVRAFGNTMNLILIPCITVVSLGRGITYDLFFSDGGWVLAVIGFTSSLAYAAIGFGLRLIAKPDPAFARLFVVMLAIPNIVAIPISLSESLCQYGAFDDEFTSRSSCSDRARAYVFLYISLDAMNTWVIAFAYLVADAPAAAPIVAAQPAASVVTPGDVKLMSTANGSPLLTTEPPPNSSCAICNGTTAVASLAATSASSAAGSPPPSPSPAADVTLVTPSTTLAASPAAATTTRVSNFDSTATRPSGFTIAWQQLRSLFRRPPVVAMVIGMVIGLIEPLQTAFFGTGQLEAVGLALVTLSNATVPTINLMVAFSLGHKLRSLRRWRDLLGSAAAGISTRTLLVLSLGRMVILPLIDGLVLYSLFPILPSSRLLRVMLFIEMAPPTASIVVLLAHLAKNPKLAQLCAFALVPQYALVPITLTATIAIALRITQ